MCGVVFGCPNLGEGAIGVQWVETRDVAQHPHAQHSRLPPTTKNHPGQISVVLRGRNLFFGAL